MDKLTYFFVLASICFLIMAIITVATSSNSGNSTVVAPPVQSPTPDNATVIPNTIVDNSSVVQDDSVQIIDSGMNNSTAEAMQEKEIEQINNDSPSNTEGNADYVIPDNSIPETTDTPGFSPVQSPPVKKIVAQPTTKSEPITTESPAPAKSSIKTSNKVVSCKLPSGTMLFHGPFVYFKATPDSKGLIDMGTGNAGKSFIIISADTK